MQPWKKIKEEIVYKGHRTIIKKTFELPDGKQSTFDIVGNGDTVLICAITKENELVITRQFRPGPEEMRLEMPGGYIDGDEVPEVAAARELLEETGFQGEMTFLTTIERTPYVTGKSYLCVAKNCVKVQEAKLDENEFVDVELIPIKAFRERLNESLTLFAVYLALDSLNLL